MKIAVSGTHHTGKTTLIAALNEGLPTFEAFEEPYYQLEAEGHTFAESPSQEDFELQLERSIASVLENDGDCLFDRCPADPLAYLTVEADGFDLNGWLPRIRPAMAQLDLVIFVPIEDPDRMTVPEWEDPRLRQLVDEELRSTLLDDQWDFGVQAIEVTGSPGERARQVLACVGDLRPK